MVVVIGVAGEQGVDLLGEDGFDEVADELGGREVVRRGRRGCPRDVRGRRTARSPASDEATTLEINEKLLRAEIPQGKVFGSVDNHDLEPP